MSAPIQTPTQPAGGPSPERTPTPEREAAGGLVADLRERYRTLLLVPELGIAVAAVLVFAGWSLATPLFLTSENLLTVAQQIALLGIVATGMTLLMVAGELDLSVGSAYGFLAVFVAWLVGVQGLDPVLGVTLTLAMGAAIGTVNGLITTRIGIPSFVVTLAMLGILRGLALLLADGLPVTVGERGTWQTIVSGRLFGQIPAQALWFVAIVCIGAFVLAKTKFGSDVYATGGNAAAAANAGIATRRTKLLCFALTGTLVAVSACILAGWLGSAEPSTGQGFELSVIAAVVIGGTGLAGGTGSVVGTFLGAAVIGMISNGLVLTGVNDYWQQVVTGGIILLAVVVQQFTGRRALR
jgi:ribose transport system permease protein